MKVDLVVLDDGRDGRAVRFARGGRRHERAVGSLVRGAAGKVLGGRAVWAAHGMRVGVMHGRISSWWTRVPSF